LLSPCLDFLPYWLAAPIHFVLPLVTVAFIFWNLKMGVSLFKKEGTLAPVAVSIPQFFLFGVLFFQVSVHWGAQHFQSERPPRMLDWFLFATAHAILATDLSGLNIQNWL
jgi:hypothetical protein